MSLQRDRCQSRELKQADLSPDHRRQKSAPATSGRAPLEHHTAPAFAVRQASEPGPKSAASDGNRAGLCGSCNIIRPLSQALAPTHKARRVNPRSALCQAARYKMETITLPSIVGAGEALFVAVCKALWRKSTTDRKELLTKSQAVHYTCMGS